MDWLALLNVAEVIAGGALGGTAAVYGLSRFLGDAWLGRMLEKEKAKYAKELEGLKSSFAQELEHYRAQLDRSIFVTRAHFETEFTAMKEVTQRLSDVKVIWLKLHPVQFGRKDVELYNGLESLHKAAEAFHEKLEEWAVFIDIEIYDEFNRCYIGADEEWRRLKAGNEENDPAEIVKHFWDAYRHACQKVRDRIKNLAVMPRS
jgi:hypothetical protein